MLQAAPADGWGLGKEPQGPEKSSFRTAAPLPLGHQLTLLCSVCTSVLSPASFPLNYRISIRYIFFYRADFWKLFFIHFYGQHNVIAFSARYFFPGHLWNTHKFMDSWNHSWGIFLGGRKYECESPQAKGGLESRSPTSYKTTLWYSSLYHALKRGALCSFFFNGMIRHLAPWEDFRLNTVLATGQRYASKGVYTHALGQRQGNIERFCEPL